MDAISFETFMDFTEIEIAFQAKKAVSDTGENLFFRVRADGRLPSGMQLKDAFKRLCATRSKNRGRQLHE